MKNPKARVLHICSREMLRPLRDQVLRIHGYEVDSTLSTKDGLETFQRNPYDVVLVDVEGEKRIPDAEQFCSAVKTAKPHQLVAFVCNWRVAIQTDCPDEILRTEFNPEEFVKGINRVVDRLQ